MSRRAICLVCGASDDEVKRMHYFPSNIKKSQIWQESMGMVFSGYSLSHNLICSNHFTEDSYAGVKLTRYAVPTLFPCTPTVIEPTQNVEVSNDTESLNSENVLLKDSITDKTSSTDSIVYNYETETSSIILKPLKRLNTPETQLLAPEIKIAKPSEAKITEPDEYDYKGRFYLLKKEYDQLKKSNAELKKQVNKIEELEVNNQVLAYDFETNENILFDIQRSFNIIFAENQELSTRINHLENELSTTKKVFENNVKNLIELKNKFCMLNRMESTT